MATIRETVGVPSTRFAEDLRASASALRQNPWLPALTFLIFAGPAVFNAIALVASGYDPACYGEFRPPEGCVEPKTVAAAGIASLISFPLALISVGWIGSERIWFLRAFRGGRMTPGEAFRLLWQFWGRYFRLGLLFAVGYVPVLIVALVTRNVSLFIWLVVPFTLIFDFVMTFVTPALAYSTNSVLDAMSIGWEMIRKHWPRSAPYVFLPPLVLLILGRQLPSSFIGLWGTTVIACVGTLANLWFKGAVAAFYLRDYPGVPDEGSAWLKRSQPSYPSYPDVPPPGTTWPS